MCYMMFYTQSRYDAHAGTKTEDLLYGERDAFVKAVVDDRFFKASELTKIYKFF